MTDYEAGYTQALLDAIQAVEAQKMNPDEDADDVAEYDTILAGNAALGEAVNALSHLPIPTEHIPTPTRERRCQEARR